MIIKIIARHRVQVGHIADDFVMIRMNAKCRLLDGFAQQKQRFVLAAFTLRNDDRSLGCNFIGIETGC